MDRFVRALCLFCLVVGFLAVVGLRPAFGQRVWTTLVAETLECQAKDVEKGTPMGFPGGPDPRVRRTFQIPSRGLIRVTTWVMPYYPHSRRDPNTGGVGLVRTGDDTSLGYPPIWDAAVPREPIEGVQYMRSFVGNVDPRRDAWVELTPAVSVSGWAQLKVRIRALVEFSPGPAAPGESFAPPVALPGEPPPPPPPPEADLAGAWEGSANGYDFQLEFRRENGRLTGRLYYVVAKQWETLTDVVWNPETKEVSFTRPWRGNPTFQRYRGRLIGVHLSGTFSDSNSPGQEFRWDAAVK